MLRAQGAIAEPALPSDPVSAEVRHYDDYMRDVRGLSARPCLSEFLAPA